MKPRVLTLLPSLEVGGIERVSLSLVRALGARFDFTTVAFDRDGPLRGEFDAAGSETIILRRRPGVDIAYPPRLARVIRDVRPDLVHCHNETALFYGRFAAGLARVPAVVYTEHDRRFPGRPRLALLNRALGRTCRRLVTVSKRLRDELAAHEGFDRARIRVIRNGVDGGPFEISPSRASVLEEFGLQADTNLVVSVGRLSPEKGLDRIIAAAPAISFAVPSARFLIVGGGAERRRLEASADPAIVRFAGERGDVPRLMTSADLVVIPSRSEGLPLAALEAAAASRATVATDVGALSEVIEDGVTGRLVPSGDGSRLVGTVCALLADAPLRTDMGRRARTRFEETFSLERMAREYEEVYLESMGRAC